VYTTHCTLYCTAVKAKITSPLNRFGWRGGSVVYAVAAGMMDIAKDPEYARLANPLGLPVYSAIRA
jgi:hypothetical protein